MAAKDILLRTRLKQGRQLVETGRFAEARVVYEQICARRRNDIDSWYQLAAINGMLGRHADVVACCSRVVELEPRHLNAWYNLGIALRDNGQLEQAVAALHKTLALDPRHEGAAASLGHILTTLHRYEQAEEVFRRVLEYQPGNAEFYAVYGSAMQTMGHYEAAIKAYHKAIEMRHPQTAEIHENLAAALCMQGKFEESIEATRNALEMAPDNTRVYSGMLLTQQYLVGHDADSLLEQHRRWPGNVLRPTVALSRKLSAPRAERLRIGYVSADFRRHSVSYFFEPLLAGHDDARFEITCYFSHKDADATTRRLQQLAHRWRDVADVDDQQLLQLITDDGIDILVDLNGHTSGGRLGVFARRAAPVQVSFIGYPDTTGVAEMDYRFSDAIADPLGTESRCTETLIRLPGCFLCYQPPTNAPDVSASPAEENGYITFGSFNNLAKVNSRVIEVWAELLKSVPGSRLVIKNPSLTDLSTRERYQAQFADRGISPECIDLVGFMPDDASHLAAYGRIDIALDTFPYNGTTTTCEALWMGVPVVSLCGDRHSARVGASLLTAVGHSEWIADTIDRYIDIARHMARDAVGLSRLRSALRQQMMASRLCSVEPYVKAVENAYDEIDTEARCREIPES